MSLSVADQNLLELARDVIARRGKADVHEIGAAVRTRSGRTFAAVHLEAYVGRVAVCAEAIALGMAAAVGDTDIEAVVAVRRSGEVVSPCGMCRELVLDYAPDARVILLEGDELATVDLASLLPRKYSRE